MTNRLTDPEIADLNRASSEAIVAHLNSLHDHFRDGRWLGERNVYRLKPVSEIVRRTPESGRERPIQLGAYVAASCPLHLWDGWNYLGLAVYAHVCGATSNSKHLAYYAELRAAMALLASQGVGIFNDRHCIVEAPNSILYLTTKRGTHVATQLCLEHWASGVQAADVLGQILMMERTSILDWLLELRQAGAWSPIGTELIRQAGLDLKRMSDDRRVRNEASYRPTGIVPSQIRDAKADADFVINMIGLLEPGGMPGTFENLDRYLCRRMLEGAYRAGTGKSDVLQLAEYRLAIESMLGEYIDGTMKREELERFLSREQESEDPTLLLAADRDGNQRDPDYHLQIIGRATILLRIATGVARQTFTKADLSLDSLKFWWQRAGLAGGFWNDPPCVVDSSELWLDISNGLEDLDRWIQSDASSRQSLLAACAESIVQTTGMSRFALMGLAS